jgi:sigma-B regulation protein RsbU (phosphoserine phosphatase)
MLETEVVCRHLRSSIFLQSATDETILDLANQVEWVSAKAGDIIFEKGDAGSAIYFVIEGSARIHDGDLVLNHLGVGEAFGEVGALSSMSRTASVTAELDSQLLKLDRQALFDTMTRQPEAARCIIEALCQREGRLIHDGTERAIKAQLVERELAIAQQIQRSFLPDAIPDLEGWTIEGFLQPAREVGGDFYDFFKVPGLGCMGFVIGDVCDKGVGAALFMTLFRSLIRATSLYGKFKGQGDSTSDAVKTLRHCVTLTNEYVATTHQKSSTFTTLFYGLIIPETGQLCYINAGHEAPLIVGKEGIRTRLEQTGPVIGIFPDAVHEVKVADILPGELLVAYTDGATDAKNEAGEQFSEERLHALVARGAPTATAMVHKLVSEIMSFIGGADQFDDVTLVAACYEGNNQSVENPGTVHV